MSESAAALERYSAFVETVLRPQLKQTLVNRDALACEVQEYQKLRELLRELAKNGDSPTNGTLHTLVDVGERFHVRAKVPDMSLISVNIGLNFYVELTVSEAQQFVQKLLLHLTEKRNRWQEKAREVSDHVNVVIASIQQLAALQ